MPQIVDASCFYSLFAFDMYTNMLLSFFCECKRIIVSRWIDCTMVLKGGDDACELNHCVVFPLCRSFIRSFTQCFVVVKRQSVVNYDA